MTSRISRELSQEAQLRLIDIRYRSAARSRGKRTTPAALRVSELERIFTHRFGKVIPNNPEGREALQIFAEALCFTKRPVNERLTGYVNARAPWASAEAEAMAAAAVSVARWQSADELAWRIGLSLPDREKLGICTIGAIGYNKRQRAALQRAKRKERERLRRRANGAKPRHEGINRRRPWEAEGISRRTWFRRRARKDGTNSCPVLSSYLRRHESVPQITRCLRDALRAGPMGHGPCGPRAPEQVDRSVNNRGEEIKSKVEAHP